MVSLPKVKVLTSIGQRQLIQQQKKKAHKDDAKGGGHSTIVKKERASHPIYSGGIIDVIDG